jgi:uroporphyrinogen-III synthase
MILLSTKILSEATKQRLHDANIELIDKDFIQIIFLQNIDFQPFIKNNYTFVFTSKNGVEGFYKNIEKDTFEKNAFCIEGKTQEILEKKGWTIVASAKNATLLAQKIIERNANHLVFCKGNLSLEILPFLLENNNIKLQEIEVYQTTLTPQVIDNQYDTVAFYSPSGVESFFQKNTLLLDKQVFCIGTTTEKIVKQHFQGKIMLSPKADIEYLIEMIIRQNSIAIRSGGVNATATDC